MICLCILVYSCFVKNSSNSWYQSNAEVKYSLTNLKNNQQYFYGEERILPT
jgi:hypothetical protein